MRKTDRWVSAEINMTHPQWGHQVLTCPQCGGAYLHHGAVRTYDRGEDAVVTTVATLVEGRSTARRAASVIARNPSSRRHGLVIAFACEECGCRPELTLAQHKGVSLLEWRFLRVPRRPGEEMDPDMDYPLLREEPVDLGPLHPAEHFPAS
jgi:hypothetical protein